MSTAGEQEEPGSPRRGRPVAFALLRQGEHVLFVGLLALGVGQAVAARHHAIATTVLGLALLAWYAWGAAITRRERPGRLRHDSLRDRQRTAAWWLAGLVIGWLGLVVLAEDFVWLVFAIFLLLLQALPLRWSVPLVLALALAAVAAVTWHQGQLRLAVVVGPLTGAAVAIVITVVYRDLRAESERRAALVAQLTEAQERVAAAERYAGTLAERERLAREIHDTVAQGLSSIVLLLRAVDREAGALPDPARRQLEAAADAAATALEDTRRVVRALGPGQLEGQSLVDALARMVADAGPVGVDLRLEVDGDPYEVPTGVAVALLRTAQGALGNVIAHSVAQRARITLTYQPDEVRLDVGDDGRGFDTSAPVRGSASGTGIGLAAMRSRLAEVGGTLTVESTPGRGTAVSATVPTKDGAPREVPVG